MRKDIKYGEDHFPVHLTTRITRRGRAISRQTNRRHTTRPGTPRQHRPQGPNSNGTRSVLRGPPSTANGRLTVLAAQMDYQRADHSCSRSAKKQNAHHEHEVEFTQRNVRLVGSRIDSRRETKLGLNKLYGLPTHVRFRTGRLTFP